MNSFKAEQCVLCMYVQIIFLFNLFHRNNLYFGFEFDVLVLFILYIFSDEYDVKDFALMDIIIISNKQF